MVSQGAIRERVSHPVQRGKMIKKTRTRSGIVQLHEHRELKDHPEKELTKLLWRLLQEKHQGNILAASDAYAESKAAEILAQIVGKGRIDRDELYDSLIAWALIELGEIQPHTAVA